MIETSEHSVNQPFRTVEPPNPPYGVPPPDVDPRPLRIPPPAAHPPSSRYSGQIRSPSHGSGERDGSRRPSRDPEKASTGYPPMSSHGLPSQCTSVAYTGEESEFGDEGDDVKRHAVWILV